MNREINCTYQDSESKSQGQKAMPDKPKPKRINNQDQTKVNKQITNTTIIQQTAKTNDYKGHAELHRPPDKPVAYFDQIETFCGISCVGWAVGVLDSSSGRLRWAELLRFAVVALIVCGGLVRGLWLPGGWYLRRICIVWWYLLR